MSFIDLAKKRYSVRKYTDQKIEKEKLEQILEAGRIAPTACNMQPQRLLVIESAEGIAKLKKAANVFNAPTAVIIFGDKTDVWTRPQDGKKTIDIDASIITDHMLHAATELGLGSLWMTWFDPAVIMKEFGVPENFVPVNVLLLGYASGPAASPDRHSRVRKALEETVFYESFGGAQA
jgi:nitroreductase